MGYTSELSTLRRAVGLSGVEVYGHIGYMPEEQHLGRRFRVDVEAQYTLPEVGADPPIDYREIAAFIRQFFAQPGTLIEHLAQGLAEAILQRWPAVEKVQVRVHKVHPPIGILAESAYAYVEMVRP